MIDIVIVCTCITNYKAIWILTIDFPINGYNLNFDIRWIHHLTIALLLYAFLSIFYGK